MALIKVPWKIATSILDRRTWIMYLQIVEGMHTDWERAVAIEPAADFYKKTEAIVEAYLEKGVAPPAAIAVPIMNIADDVAAGREVTIRAGDYVALQTHYRAHHARLEAPAR